MVTGDHIKTAIKVAADAGIITEAQRAAEDVALSGDKFAARARKFEDKCRQKAKSEWPVALTGE